jgi:hypothetical protein
MVFSDRRYAQSAADAASLAGGGAAGEVFEAAEYSWNDFDCGSQVVIDAKAAARQAAIARAQSFGFTIDNDISDNMGVVVTCTDPNNPPENPFPERYLDTKVMVTMQTPTTFAHLIFNQPIENIVTAITRTDPKEQLGFGNTLVSLSMECSKAGGTGGIDFVGGPEVILDGGGAFSNSCLKTGGSGTVEVNDGEILYFTDWYDSGVANYIDPDPKLTPATYDDTYFRENITPECDAADMVGRGSITAHNGDIVSLEPGVYDSISITGGDVTMAPGLYCFIGDTKITGGSLSGDNITMVALNGDISIEGDSGGDQFVLKANGTENVIFHEIPGMLIYVPPTNSATIKLAGNEASSYEGVIYAPTSSVTIVGTSTTGSEEIDYDIAVIAYYINIGGTATLDVTNYQKIKFTTPSSLSLLK